MSLQQIISQTNVRPWSHITCQSLTTIDDLNAHSLHGRGVDETQPLEGQILIYRTASGEYDHEYPMTNSDISWNTSDIAANTSDIALNVSNITINQSDIASNLNLIIINQSDIASNLVLISNNTSDLVAASSDIAANLLEIRNNDSDVASNLTLIGNNSSDIASNLTLIGNNQSDITTNIGSIATNASDIQDLQALHAGGGGPTDPSDLQLLMYDGATYTNITAAVAAGYSNIFPSDLAGNSVLIGSNSKFAGFKYSQNTSSVSASDLSFEMESYNGSLVKTTFMDFSDRAGTKAGKRFLSNSSDTNLVSFRARSNWQQQTLDGLAKYWISLKASDDVQNVQIKDLSLFQDGVYTNSDNYSVWFGSARKVIKLPVEVYSLQRSHFAGGDTADMDIWFGQDSANGGKLYTSVIGNALLDSNQTDKSVHFTLPPNIDYSFPIRAQFGVFIEQPTEGEFVNIEYRNIITNDLASCSNSDGFVEIPNLIHETDQVLIPISSDMAGKIHNNILEFDINLEQASTDFNTITSTIRRKAQSFPSSDNYSGHIALTSTTYLAVINSEGSPINTFPTY